jgi:hypothetical protein
METCLTKELPMSDFEKASRLKLRFDSVQGKISVEDLWDLPLTTKSANRASLDDVAKATSRALKTSGEEESFVLKTTPANSLDKLRLDIVKQVISVRLAEAEESEKAAVNKAKKAQILAIIDQKKDAALSNLSVEDLTKLLAEL